MKTLILFLAFAGVAVSQPMNGGGGGGAAITPGTISIKEDFNNLVPAIASANGLIGTYGWSTTVQPAGSGSIASVSGGADLNHAGIVQISAGAAIGDTTTPTTVLDNFNDHQSVDVAAIPVLKVAVPPALSTTKRKFGLERASENTYSPSTPSNAARPTP